MKIKSVGLRKATTIWLCAAKCLHFFALHHGGQNSWHW